MTAPRIAVTGVGMVSALGQSAAETFRRLMAGERGIAPLELFDPGDVRSRQVGEVRGLRVSDVFDASSSGQASRTEAMAVLAAREAAAQARLTRGVRLGVALGGTTGGMFESEAVLSSPDLATLPDSRAVELVSYPLSASLSRVGQAFGGAAISRGICSACSGGAIALVQAVAWLASGQVDAVLAGGADGLCRLTVLGFNSLGATDPEPCRPFDRARGGLNLGEGAALLVLEREADARRRGAEVLAFLDGFAVGAEAHHITHPDPSGACATRLMRRALERAGRDATGIGYVNAHGTGTRQNDAMEGRALLEVLGSAAPDVWVSSSKAQLGHSLGASGALEAAITVLSLQQGRVPPTAGLMDPELSELRHVTQPQTAQRLEAALSSSFGFGGMSCVLALAASHTAAPPTVHRARRVTLRAAAVLDPQRAPEKLLDPERSRRFDRSSAFASLGASALAGSAQAREVGLVLGTAFGNVERTMAFLARGAQRGPRQVPPAEFPHLVPSAPAGNASVYAGLTGPVFAVSDLAQSGEAAFASGLELIELGVAELVVVGAVAARDAIVERVLGPLLEPSGAAATRRGEGAAFLLLEALGDEPAAGTGALVLERRAGALGVQQLPERARGVRAEVVLGAASRDLLEALQASSWGEAPLRDLAAAGGYHEALGAEALAAALRRLQGEPAVDQVLVLSGSTAAFSAILLGRGAVAKGG